MKNWFRLKQTYGTISKKDWPRQDLDHIDSLYIRFNRWHDKQIDLLTFLINLIFILSIAILGFIVDKWDFFNDKKVYCHPLSEVTSTVLLTSILVGIVTLFFRLYDFRKTKNVIKYRIYKFKLENDFKYEAYESYNIDELEKKIKKNQKCNLILGDLTWTFFWIQSILFIISIVILISCI